MKKSILLIGMMFLTVMPIIAQGKSSKNKEVRIMTTAQCTQCKDRIESALAFEKGVRNSVLDLETKEVKVYYKEGRTTEDKIRRAITKLGYDADNMKKDETAYKKLPACCKMPDDPDYIEHSGN